MYNVYMCLSFPKKVKSVKGPIATLEDGSKARFDEGMNVKKGQLVQVTGTVITSVISKKAASAMVKLMKESSL